MTDDDDLRARKKRLWLAISCITVMAILLGIWQLWALSQG